MQLGSDKYAYIYIERGKNVSLGEEFKINELELSELTEGEQYKYIGQDENVLYDNSLNKERVVKEYFKRVGKIWS